MDEDRGTMSDGCNSGLDNEAKDATVEPAGSRVRGIENLFAGIFSARLDKSALPHQTRGVGISRGL